MTKRDGAHDEDYDMLVIGSGLGGRVAALQLTKKKNRTRLLAVGGRSPDGHFAETSWDIKRFAWAPLGLKGTRRIFWLPKVMVHAGVGVVGCSRVLQRMWKSRSSTNCDCTASTDSESLPGPSRPLHPRVAPWRLPTRLQSVCGGVDQDVSIADRDDHFVNRCWRSILSKQSRCLPLLSAGLGCLRRAMRWRAAASSTAADQERSPSIPSRVYLGTNSSDASPPPRPTPSAPQSAVHIFLYYGCPSSSAALEDELVWPR